MRASTRPPIIADPHVLLAIAEYRQRGLGRLEIMARLRISEKTYYRCLESISRRAKRSALQDSDE